MAANIARGEFEIEYEGRTLLLKQTMAASMIVQDRTGKTVGELYFSAGRNDVKSIRELSWMLLQANYAAEFPTLEDSDRVFDYHGGPKPFFDYLEAINEYEEASKAAKKDKADKVNPQKAQAGTGSGSNRSRSK